MRRAYADWTAPGQISWRPQLVALSIRPVHQFSYAAGKNSADSAMVIDAMDLLYSGRVDGFCLVSSDSDFTPLAVRLRESGLPVYGFGERKTPEAFVEACNVFIHVENLAAPAPDGSSGFDRDTTGPVSRATTIERLRANTELLQALRAAVGAAADETGFADLAQVGQILRSRSPSFDPRTYGYVKLGNLIAATGAFAVERRVPGANKPPVMFVRQNAT